MKKFGRFRDDIKTGEVLAYVAEGHTLAETSRRFNCHTNLITNIVNGTRGLLQKKKADVYRKRILELHKQGASFFEIQKKIGVSHAVVYEAVFNELPASYNIHRTRKSARRPIKTAEKTRKCRTCNNPIDNLNRFFCSYCHRHRVGTCATNAAAV